MHVLVWFRPKADPETKSWVLVASLGGTNEEIRRVRWKGGKSKKETVKLVTTLGIWTSPTGDHLRNQNHPPEDGELGPLSINSRPSLVEVVGKGW